MTLRFSLLAAAALAVAAAPHAQTVTRDAEYTPTRSASVHGRQVLSADLDGKDREVLLTSQGSRNEELRLERFDVFGGPDPTLPSLDLTPALPPGSYGFAGAVSAFSGDSLAVAGSYSTGDIFGAQPRSAFVGRFGENGGPAAGYGPGGIAPLALPFQADIAAVRVEGARTYLAVQNVQTNQCAVAAVTSGGRLDASFGTDGLVQLPTTESCETADLLILGDRVYLLATLSTVNGAGGGTSAGAVFARSLTGAAVSAFGTDGRASVSLPGEFLRMTTLAEWNGKIAVGGYTFNGVQNVVVASLTAAGQPDATFGNRGGIDVREAPFGLFGPRVGLAAISGALVAVTSGRAAPRQQQTPGGPIPFNRYGILSSIYGFGGNRVDQASGPNGFGFVQVTEIQAGSRQFFYSGTWADVTSQGRIVTAGRTFLGGNGDYATEVIGLRLDGFGTAAADAPAGVQALRVAPNPTAAGARITLSLEAPAAARVVVTDALGRTVAVLADGALPAGETALRLDAAGLPAGVYAVVATVGGQRTTARITVVR